jgi:uncharacterized protein (DUF885 family)
MRLSVLFFISSFIILNTVHPQTAKKKFSQFVEDYFQEKMKLNPVDATVNGDNRFNDRLYNDLSDSFRTASRKFYKSTLASLRSFDRKTLSRQDQYSYDILKHEAQISLEGFSIADSVLVINQMRGLPQMLALLGSGSVIQPFNTVTDYDNWLKRAAIFPEWTDSAIAFFQKGIVNNIVHPTIIVERIIPQLQDLIVENVTESNFYEPVKKMPASFSAADKQRLTAAYTDLIAKKLNPSYQKLATFLKEEYLPHGRTSYGYSNLPGGKDMYQYYLRYYTTTNTTPDEIYALGLSEVARIEKEMLKVKNQVGFSGDLKSFFEDLRTNPKFFTYKSADDVLNAYRDVLKKITPRLDKLFHHKPKAAFEIRQTEPFRAATASIEYLPGSFIESRPGIFYVPVVDATKMIIYESTFAHESIPGHHYQLMLQAENMELPNFRRFGGNAAYEEGWALYVESLGKELGLYTDPYQYMRALSDNILRGVRLVVDAGLHSKGWSREKAIDYMVDHVPMSKDELVAEVERYMVWPGQATAYKMGELKIRSLRAKYEKLLGKKFNLADFHDELLKDGAMPLNVLERKMDAWAAK